MSKQMAIKLQSTGGQGVNPKGITGFDELNDALKNGWTVVRVDHIAYVDRNETLIYILELAEESTWH